VTETIEWTNSYRLGIPAVDQEHRTFFALLRALETSLDEVDARGVRQALKNLRLYAMSHFEHEEEFLEAVGYPELSSHKAEHSEFMRDVMVLEGTPGLPPPASVRMARAWIGQHILGTDKRYARWLEEQVPLPRIPYRASA
jgi:hemerythrin